MWREFHGVDRKFDVHVSLHSARNLAVGELNGWLRHHGKTVAVRTVRERPERGMCLAFQERGALGRPQQPAALHKLLAQELAVDVESQRPRRDLPLNRMTVQSQLRSSSCGPEASPAHNASPASSNRTVLSCTPIGVIAS